jgi:hypothetical protein
MRPIYRIGEAVMLAKSAQSDGITPDVRRFISEAQALEDVGDTPERRDFILRLMKASKNVQKFLDDQLDYYNSLKTIYPILTKTFNEGEPWMVQLVVNHIARTSRVPHFMEHMLKTVDEKDFGQPHLMVMDEMLKMMFSSYAADPKNFSRVVIKSVSDAMEMGQMSELVYTRAVNDHMFRDGNVPWWAREWVRGELKKMGSGLQASGILQQRISDMVNTDGNMHVMPEQIASWIENSFQSRQAPPWLVEAVASRFSNTGHVPHYASSWVKEMVGRAVAAKAPLPDKIAEGIGRHLEVAGDASYADEYVSMALENGYATPEMERVYHAMLELHREARTSGGSAIAELHPDNHKLPKWFPPSARAEVNRRGVR